MVRIQTKSGITDLISPTVYRHVNSFLFLLMLKYLKEKVSGCEGKAEEDSCYEGWYKKHILTEQPLECDVQFSRLFQNLQIRSTTEAIAETVGSIMNQLLGKNR